MIHARSSAISVQTLTVAALVLNLLLAPSPSSAIVYSGFGGRPAFPRSDNPRTNDIFIHTLEPGAVQPEGVSVINNGDTSKTLMVYAADSTPSTDGGFACKQLSEQRQGVGAWIVFGYLGWNPDATSDLVPKKDDDGDGLTNAEETTRGTNPEEQDTDGDGISDNDEITAGTDPLSPVVVTVEPEKSVLVPFTITVPTTAGVGEHNGCILIQEKKDGAGTAEGIAISTRTGIRVALTVPGEIQRRLSIVRLDVLPRVLGGKTLHPVVRNDGNVSIDADIRLTTANLFGKVTATHGGQYAILRETTSEWNFELAPTFWGGWYRTNLKVSYDANSGKELGTTNTPTVTLAGPTVAFFLMPSALAWGIYGGAFVLLAAAVLLIILARKRRRLIAATWKQYTVQKHDTLKSLGQQYDVSWKILARANKLRPPYELEPGTSLLVPPTAKSAPPATATKPAVKTKGGRGRKKTRSPSPQTSTRSPRTTTR